MNTQAKVAIHKQEHPDRYCRNPRCLWRILVCHPITRELVLAPNCVEGYCPRHKPVQSQNSATALDWIRNGYAFPGKPSPFQP